MNFMRISRRKIGTCTMDKGLTKMNRGRHLSYKRSRHNTSPSTSLIKIEGVDDSNAAKYVSVDQMGTGEQELT